ncbi:hypothetical protein BDR03DRAFT_207691 [Suillus americanus]|nr:hypothetical protein BDR03DRAFT_207691 [Suillus americanus]
MMRAHAGRMGCSIWSYVGETAYLLAFRWSLLLCSSPHCGFGAGGRGGRGVQLLKLIIPNHYLECQTPPWHDIHVHAPQLRTNSKKFSDETHAHGDRVQNIHIIIRVKCQA